MWAGVRAAKWKALQASQFVQSGFAEPVRQEAERSVALCSNRLDERLRLGCPGYSYWDVAIAGDRSIEAIASKFCEISQSAHLMIGRDVTKL